MSAHEPVLELVEVSQLKPTQMTVGYREVAQKRREWRERAEKDGPEYLGRHLIPVLRGPHGKMYVIDHHHLARALQMEGVEKIAVSVVSDLTGLRKREFWTFCDNHGWCHPYDGEGERKTFDAIPAKIDGLKDDPYRSLAGELRRAGGYAKETQPFVEFMWADFLRRRIKKSLLETEFASAVSKALAVARSDAAQHLPGWCGPSDDD